VSFVHLADRSQCGNVTHKVDNNTITPIPLSYAFPEEIASEFIPCLFEAHEPN